MNSPTVKTTNPSNSLSAQLQQIGLRALPTQLDDFLAHAAKARWSPHQILEQLDVTQQKEAEEALKVATRTKSQFLANMSHEIRTPLAAIIGYTESFIGEQMSVEEQNEALHTVLNNGKHLLGILAYRSRYSIRHVKASEVFLA